MRAFIFPGQGAQIIGMGKDIADQYSSAKAVFEEVDSALGENLSALIWDGDIETLTLTSNAQPALMATSIAVMAALAEEGVGIDTASYAMGHSLGEYSALCATGALALDDTARLLRLRGDAMQAAVPVGEGAMAAILGLDFATVDKIAKAAAEGDVCQAANDNDPSQTVISGSKAAVERALTLAKDAGAKRALLLPVSAPFHSELMEPAARAMAEALDDVDIHAPVIPVVTNVMATATRDPAAIRSQLVTQVTGRVRWRESVEFLAANNVLQTVEVGAGKALSGMVKRTAKSIETQAVGTVEQVQAIAKILGA